MARKRESTGWTLQSSPRSKGKYYQAVYGSGGDRVALTIGYLNDAEDALARQNLPDMPPPASLLVTAWDRDTPCPLPTRAALTAAAKGWLLDDTAAHFLEAMAAIGRADATALEAKGQYGDLRLEDFVERIYWPVREARNAKTAKREKWLWKAIYVSLGPVRVKDLGLHRWNIFLLSQETWCPRTRQIVQNAYRACLKYAVRIGAISQVHPMELIKGGNQRYTPAGEALTDKEVSRVLAVAHTPMHRALFATAIGQGTRPTEVGKLLWSDVNWNSGFIRFRNASKNAKAMGWVPMTRLTLRELTAWWKVQGRPTTGYPFTWLGIPMGCWIKSWKTAVRKSGIDPDGTRRLIPYSARYTYATLAAVAGVPPAAVRAGMRHTGRSRILETVYERLQDSQVADALKAFPACDSADEASNPAEGDSSSDSGGK